uniref:Uncharacterized protein n=1 Tax=Plectus sambesii TaxID=2011161 RepID=A0A914UVN3_9BILA
MPPGFMFTQGRPGQPAADITATRCSAPCGSMWTRRAAGAPRLPATNRAAARGAPLKLIYFARAPAPIPIRRAPRNIRRRFDSAVPLIRPFTVRLDCFLDCSAANPHNHHSFRLSKLLLQYQLALC